MSGVNPQGCQVFSFKHPSATELQHDFLWRTTRDLPERGRIGIFNRSYYEEVLIGASPNPRSNVMRAVRDRFAAENLRMHASAPESAFAAPPSTGGGRT